MKERIQFTNKDYRQCKEYGTPECCGQCHQDKLDAIEEDSRVQIDFTDDSTSIAIKTSETNEVYIDSDVWVSIEKESAVVLALTEELDRLTNDSIDRLTNCHAEIITTPIPTTCVLFRQDNL